MNIDLSIKITLYYVIFGCAWILFSDQIIYSLNPDAAALTYLQTFKGWFYVLLTATLLFFYSKRSFYKIIAEKSIAHEALSFSSILLVHYDLKNEKYIYLSPKFLDLLGIETGDYRLLSRQQLALWIHPDDRSAYESQFEALLTGAYADSGHIARIETRFKTKDGDFALLEVERRIWFDEMGHPDFYVNSYRDITRERESERQLKETKAILQAALDQSPAGVAVADAPDGRLRYVNRAGLLVRGESEEKLVKDVDLNRYVSTWQVYNLDGSPYDTQNLPLVRAIKHGQISEATFVIRRPDEQDRIVFANAAPIMDEQGAVKAGIVVFLDVTESKRAQEALMRSEQQLAQAFELSRDVLYKRNLQTSQYVWISPACKTITGLDPETWMSASAALFRDRIHPEDVDAWLKHNNDLRQTTSATADHEYWLEFRLRHEDSSFRWISDRHILLFDEKGAALFAVGNLQDITYRKETQRTLENYEHIVSSSRDLLALVSKDFVYQAVSEAYASYFGKTRDQLIGRTVDSILTRDLARTLKPMALRCLGGEEVHFQNWLTLPSGEESFFDISYYPHYEKGTGRISGYVVSSKDLTEFKKMEDQLRQSYKMEAIGTLAGGIAHDFNNILSAIIGYADVALMMLDDKNESDQLKNTIQQVYSAGERARDLVKQILTFSRQAGHELMPVQIRLVVSEALKFIRASLPATIEIKSHLISDSYILADHTRIHQVIMNLCTNAAYSMKENGGTLSVVLRDVDIDHDFIARHPALINEGKYVQLTVSDTGPGIPKDVIDRIFDPFFTTKPKGEGTGMGLSVVHGIVKSYQGGIFVSSQAGQGTTFNVYLPAAETIGQHVDASRVNLEPVPTGTERILFVDDEKALVHLGEKTLANLGYKVTAVCDSTEALNLLARGPDDFDLVITDLTMPGLTGERLAQRINAIRPDLPIILVTGFSDKIQQGSLEASGIKKLLLKPVVKRVMAQAIREVLD